MVTRNNLYPVFLKAAQLQILIVGGGNVALEKLGFLLKSSPDANVFMVAPEFKEEIKKLAKPHQVTLEKSRYAVRYLEHKHMVIACTDDESVNQKVYRDCRTRSILVNVADNPPLCDFYMGGIVTKGNLKLAISTNGTSPTLAKRLRQFFEEVLPENLNDLADNLNEYRNTIKGDFNEKVNTLNEVTKSLLNQKKK